MASIFSNNRAHSVHSPKPLPLIPHRPPTITVDNYPESGIPRLSRASGASIAVVEGKDGDVPHIRHWPTEPRPLKKRTFSSVLFSIGEAVLILGPLAFIALAIAVAVLNGQAVKDNHLGSTVEQATQLGPTIFPILFAAVAGRSLKTIARFSAERGAKLGNLELLMASQTVWGTFESQFLMQRMTVVGAHLFILWSLSPLGGQASLRLLEKNDTAVFSESKLRYLSTGKVSIRQSAFIGASAYQAGAAAIDSIYAASLLAPKAVKAASQDTWGNVKIPRIEMLNTSDANATGWINVPVTDSADAYTSLVGLPVVGLLTNAEANFSLKSSYVTLDCAAPQNFSFHDDMNVWTQQLGQVWHGTNMSEFAGGPFYDNRTARSTSFLLDTDLPFNNSGRTSIAVGTTDEGNGTTDPSLSQPRHVLFGNKAPSDVSTRITLINCTAAQTRVESWVHCNPQGSCSVFSMRHSRSGLSSTVLTPFELPITANLFRRLPYAAGLQGSGVSSPTDYFLNDTAGSPFAPFTALDEFNYVDLFWVPPDLFATRLALVLNTYYQISLAPLAYTGSMPSNLSLYGPDVIPIDWNNQSSPDFETIMKAPFIAETTSATTSRKYQVYVCNYLWLSFLLASSSTLLIVGFAGLVLKFRSLAPDMMGFVASMTYDNPYMTLPEGGSTLEGMERARLLRDLEVRIGDVKMGQDVGHVAFASINGRDTESVGPLQKGRTYS